jgi:hypothetical protein
MTLPAVAIPVATTAASACHGAIRRAGRALARAAETLDPGERDRMAAFARYWQGHVGVLDELLACRERLAAQVAACSEAMEQVAAGGDPAEVARRLRVLADAVEEHLGAEAPAAPPRPCLHHVGHGTQAAFTVPYLAFWTSETQRAALLAMAPPVLRTLHRLTEARHARLARLALRGGSDRRHGRAARPPRSADPVAP